MGLLSAPTGALNQERPRLESKSLLIFQSVDSGLQAWVPSQNFPSHRRLRSVYKDRLVHSLVADKRGTLRETFSALHADKRLRGGDTMVGDTVTFYLRRGPEALPTLWARVTNGRVTVMAQALVFHQTGSVCKAATALGAAERPSARVRPAMLS